MDIVKCIVKQEIYFRFVDNMHDKIDLLQKLCKMINNQIYK